VLVVGRVVAAAAGVVWLLAVDSLPFPQPAMSTPPLSASNSHLDSFRIIDSPSSGTTFAT
jgi:hypothetical protein